MENRMAEFVALLKASPGLQRLMEEMREKFTRFGTVKGKIALKDVTEQEVQSISGLLGYDVSGVKDVSIQTRTLVKALAETPYAHLELDDVLQAYYGENLTTKHYEKEQKRREEEAFFEEIICANGDTFGARWLKSTVSGKCEGMYYLRKHYRRDAKKLKAALSQALSAANQLPVFSGETKRLAVFASETTGDPHGLDNNRVAGHILQLIIIDYLTARGKSQLMAMKLPRLFAEVGILKEDMLNNVMTYGIGCSLENGLEHQGAKGFYEANEPLIMSLRLLLETEMFVLPKSGAVYIVENAGVFSEMVDRLKGSRNAALICTGGQLSTAAELLLDKLAHQGFQMYYAGDFDPEGLLIADKLKKRYPDLILWHYDASNYDLAETEVQLSDKRLALLTKIADPELKAVASWMMRRRKAGYQERLLDVYMDDILT